MEQIEGQCPCGQAMVAMIFQPRRKGDLPSVRFYAEDARGERTRAKRCPACDRDFCGVTAEQIKENAWPT